MSTLMSSKYTKDEFIEFEQRGVTSVIKHVLGTDLSHIPANVLENAGIRGTSVHESIENYFKTGEIDFHFEYKPWRKGFEKFLESVETIEPLGLELFVVGEHAKGVIDFVGMVDGTLTMIDWKTSSNMSGEVRLSAELQLQLYAELLEKEYDINIEDLEVVSVQKDKFRRIKVSRDRDIVDSVYRMYDYKCKHVKHVREDK